MIIPPLDPERLERQQVAHDKAQMLIDMNDKEQQLNGAHLGYGLNKPVTHNLDGTPFEGDSK